jgi:16S rRNA (guanine527-N7)-methyltransferase
MEYFGAKRADRNGGDHAVEGLATAWAGGPGRWVEVGAGEGWPGLVVACMKDVEMDLVEPRLRRADRLAAIVGRVGLRGRVLRSRLEGGRWVDLGSGGVPARDYDVASSRAVWPPAEWLAAGAELVGPGGVVVLHEPAAAAERPGLVRSVVAGRWVVRSYRADQ